MENKQVLSLIEKKIVLCHRSHWGLIKITDEERLRYLHNQTTNNFNSLQPGQGCQTVFVTSTGRTIDLATAYITENEVLVLVSPNRTQYLMEWLDKFIFPFDKVLLTDISSDYKILNIIGTESDAIMEKLLGNIPQSWLAKLANPRENSHAIVEISNIPVRLARGTGLDLPGYTLILPQDGATTVSQAILENGVIEETDSFWETLRVYQGRPYPDKELTEDYNPLEAGLWRCISFDKGCYIGQETIARLNTYEGVKQRLWGIGLQEPVAAGTQISLNDSKVGILTSYTEIDGKSFGLGYIRTKAGGAGLKVQVGDTEGELVAAPFLSHEYYRG